MQRLLVMGYGVEIMVMREVGTLSGVRPRGSWKYSVVSETLCGGGEMGLEM